MIEIEIKDKIYFLPEKWEDLKLSTFLEMNDLNLTEDNFENNIQIFSLLTGMPIELIDEIPIIQFKELIKYLQFLKNDKVEDLPTFNFEIDGIKYNMSNDLSKITTAQFIDMDFYIKENTKNNGKYLHTLMAIMFLQEGEKYNSELVEERSLLFLNNLYCKQVLSVFFFASIINQELREDILSLNQKK